MADVPDPLEYLRKLWEPLGIPPAGMAMPTLDLPSIEKRIAELKSIETWLNLNLSVLRMTIQALELQRDTLATLNAGIMGLSGAGSAVEGGASGKAVGADRTSAGANPFDAWLEALRRAEQASKPDPKTS